MKFDRKDIEAVAKSRVSRAEGNKSTYWTVGSTLCLVAGIFIQGYNQIAGWTLVIVGFIAFVYYMNVLSKKQNRYKAKLVRDWVEEQRQLQEQK